MTTLPPPPGDSVVRLSTPPDIVRAIPSLLGFHPTASLVVLGLAGPRRRLQMTLRVDLPPTGAEAGTAERIAARLSGEAVSACVVVLFTASADAEGPPSAPAAAGGGGRGPHRGRAFLAGASVAYAMDDALRDAGLDVRELLRAEGGRWWSYLCERPCCPPDGLPVESGPTTLLEVLRVASGRPVFADRAELVASVRRAAGEPTAALRAALRAREAATAGKSPAARAARDLAHLHSILTRAAAPASDEPTPSGPAYDDRTVARVAVALTWPAVRDASFAWTGGPLAGSATALWSELVRRVPPPYAAAPATLLAVSAYRRGDGALADAYLRRALEDDPDYRMADLVLTSLENGFRPTDVESALGLDGAPREHRRSARSAPGPGGGTDAR